MSSLIAINDLRRQSQPQRDALLAAMARVLDSGWWVLGKEVAEFEREFGAYIGRAHAVGVGNGTDALIVALRAAGVGAGHRVACVANAGFYATAAIQTVGATPIFIDVAPHDFLPDEATIEHALAQAPHCIILTHLFGRMAPVEHARARCDAAGITLIEDCAQAHGARRSGRMAGAFGHLACFSFYPTKNLGALGDAGAVLCDDNLLASRVRALRQYGWQHHKYEVLLEGGSNTRLDEMQAALLRVRLPNLDADNARRRAIQQRYLAGIRHPDIRLPRRGDEDDVAHLFVVYCERRQALREHLLSCGVASDVHYPLADYQQPILRPHFASLCLPDTERHCATVLSLPCHPALTDAEVDHVIDACQRFRP